MAARTRTGLLAFALIASASSALALRPSIITLPVWQPAPSPERLASAYPAAARDARIAGLVVLDCQILATRRADDCRLVRAAPEGQGFAEGALALAHDGRFRPGTLDGAPRDTRATLAFHFKAGGAVELDNPAPAGRRLPHLRLPATTPTYPPAALRAGQSAFVSLKCELRAGRLSDCVIDREYPEDMGFGEAAIQHVQSLDIEPETASATPEPVELKIDFSADVAGAN